MISPYCNKFRVYLLLCYHWNGRSFLLGIFGFVRLNYTNVKETGAFFIDIYQLMEQGLERRMLDREV